jgi:hypothetical protein
MTVLGETVILGCAFGGRLFRPRLASRAGFLVKSGSNIQPEAQTALTSDGGSRRFLGPG